MSKMPIVHVELSANDLQAAGSFYHELFGWEVQQMPEMNYATFETGEGSPGGGFNPITNDSPAGTVLVYIETDNTNEMLRRIEAMGGCMVVPRTEIPEMGWFAIFTDPTGNKIGLFEPLKQS